VYIKIFGWCLIFIGILAIALSIVPGAMSIIALFIAFTVLIFSIFTIKTGDLFYFKIISMLTAFNVFIANDGVRIYGSLPQILWQYKLIIYCAFIAIYALAIYFVKKRSGAIKN